MGRFPFTASGKATAAGDRDGFVKLIFDQHDKLLGAHLGANVTEMLAEPTLAKSLGATAQQIAHTIHAHPTMNEGSYGGGRGSSGCRDPRIIENYRNANGDGLHRIVPVSFAYARQGVIDNTEKESWPQDDRRLNEKKSGRTKQSEEKPPEHKGKQAAGSKRRRPLLFHR